ncbi:LLM class flavin-dependent oxidoreductase [Nesterenkonia pannonica]|uniref:LLM class flavin-dependent oxidoreductase n=1 Tax=Nesterenkonia pannonica TaxID=1548602 RepID=UPI002164BE45|nr:LLM class flavin-dependent oxidoreductase [Nesterenkonia pannonica]
MRLSLLDRSRTRLGYAPGVALHHTVERAVRAERLGYHRLWAAEHHAVPGVASGRLLWCSQLRRPRPPAFGWGPAG